MPEIRFAVVANCQARPISMIIGKMCSEWAHLGDIIVHLASPDDRDDHFGLLQDADVIFAQLVGDRFPVAHLTTSRLREAFGEKVVSWPNLFFHGQTTDSFTVTSEAGRVAGPLGDYHSLTVLEHWLRGWPVADCIEAMRNPDYGDKDEIRSRMTRSLDLLKRREQNTDVAIADFISEHWQKKRLFHIFNHPSSVTLIEMAERLLQTAGVSGIRRVTSEETGEPLDQLIPFLPYGHASALGLNFLLQEEIRGWQVNVRDGNVRLGPSKIWSLLEFVEMSYCCYDENGEAMRSARLTPPLPDLKER